MDGARFDDLTRALANRGSRRRFIGGLVACALAITGLGRVDAATCRGVGNTCSEHANCCSGLCGPKDRTSRRRCSCQSPADCPAPSNQCKAASCVDGVCGETVRAGEPCDDRDVCTTGETCQANGSCGGGTAIICQPQDQCHSATCDRVRGCVQTPLTGTTCDDGDACTQSGTCQNGQCVGGDPIVCTAISPCHDAGTCNSGTGTCSNPPKGSGTPCGEGPSCTNGTQHAQDTCDGSGTCAPGAATSCGLYVCGATACLTTCDNDNHCVGNAHCDGGVCQGDRANGESCDEASDCVSGFCNTTSSFCCSESCGAGIACTGSGFTCAAPPCGGIGQACCADDVCIGGAHCDGQLCLADLANGAACNEDSDCQSEICNSANGVCCAVTCDTDIACVSGGLVCDDDLTCGSFGQPCCAGNVCDDSFRCVGGTCFNKRDNGLGCDEDDDCRSGFCNGPSGICCSEDCADGVGCSGAGSTCGVCGGSGQPCCARNSCFDGQECGADRICVAACGGLGEDCCVGYSCDRGTFCTESTSDGFCTTCRDNESFCLSATECCSLNCAPTGIIGGVCAPCRLPGMLCGGVDFVCCTGRCGANDRCE